MSSDAGAAKKRPWTETDALRQDFKRLATPEAWEQLENIKGDGARKAKQEFKKQFVEKSDRYLHEYPTAVTPENTENYFAEYMKKELEKK